MPPKRLQRTIGIVTHRKQIKTVGLINYYHYTREQFSCGPCQITIESGDVD